MTMRAALEVHAKNRCVQRFAALVVGLALCVSADAAIVPCTGVSEKGMKLLLDEIVSSGANEVVMLTLLQRVDAALLQMELEAHSKNVGSQGGPAGAAQSLRVIRCPDRRPDTPSDFDGPTVRLLNSNQVMIEIYGITAPLPGGAGKGYQATVVYALIPIRHYEPPLGIVPVGVKIQNVGKVEDLLAALDQSGRLAAYTAAAMGLSLLRDGSYDQARSRLCLAQSRIEKLKRNNVADDLRLLELVKRSAEQAVQQARADPRYKGSLKLPIEPSCAL